ncbi:hypothetical protein [Arthrobacter sp. FW306-07-I]|uniref:hypothetical protein n=1 Tax=Arthrobacter sp. FW306-07-I TaxID=2879622 RepID=UPI001F39F68F|nr:hypothetical protein [Arthrobacter sp. FW306-07-I]UKA77329.1 hypothetical protein LFT46_10070 [Arthrobacter sp. FW306-07-I]
MDLAEHIIREIDRSWADEVNILGYWEDGPATVCVVYCRTIDPAVVLGRRLVFNSTAADGTIEGFARDVAINMAEPIGRATSRPDQHGVVWVGVSKDRRIPEPPSEVLQILRNNEPG